ncbi:MAG: Rad52/Rad22 family DNA repair protein [Chloroflexota bacterium]
MQEPKETPDQPNDDPEALDVLQKLQQPLDLSRVRRRPSPGSGTVPYLAGHDIITRANAIFDFAWSFELLSQPVIERWQKQVMIWNPQEKRQVPALDEAGRPIMERVGLVYVTGKVSVELNGKLYTHADVGRCPFNGDTTEALDTALAGCATDCLKRCFRQLGEQFGNSLHSKETIRPVRSQSRPSTNTTEKPAMMRQYLDGARVNGNVSEQQAYDRFQQSTGETPASKEALRSWLQSQRAQPQPANLAG